MLRIIVCFLLVVMVSSPVEAQKPDEKAPEVPCETLGGDVGVILCLVPFAVGTLYDLFADKDKVRDKNDEIILFEGPNCFENTVGSLPLHSEWNPFAIGLKGKGKHFDNDEAKSVLVTNPRPGAEIFLADDPGGKLSDDWIRIVLKDQKESFCVGTLEPPGGKVDNRYYSATMHYKDKLNGKVSFARVTTDSPPKLPLVAPISESREERGGGRF